jgi:hypothetical protein
VSCCDTGASAIGTMFFGASTAAFVTPFVVGGTFLDSSCAGSFATPSSFASLFANSFFAGASTAGSTADLVCGFGTRGLLRGNGMATRLGAACARLGLCDCWVGALAVGCDVISSLVVCIAIGWSMVLELWSNFMVVEGICLAEKWATPGDVRSRRIDG